jgi:hypothetical protein
MLTSTDMYRVQAQDTLYVKVKLDQDENQLFHPYFPKKKIRLQSILPRIRITFRPKKFKYQVTHNKNTIKKVNINLFSFLLHFY